MSSCKVFITHFKKIKIHIAAVTHKDTSCLNRMPWKSDMHFLLNLDKHKMYTYVYKLFLCGLNIKLTNACAIETILLFNICSTAISTIIFTNKIVVYIITSIISSPFSCSTIHYKYFINDFNAFNY